MKKLLFTAIALVLALSTVSCNIIINQETEGGETTDKVYPHSNMELADLNAIIATTENQSFPVSVLRYFFMDSYASFINQNYYYLSYIGLDLTVPLHDQNEQSTGKSWYEYFLGMGKSAFEQYAKFAEKAIEEGMELSEADLEEIEVYLDGIETSAESSGLSFEEYMEEFMGEGMTRDMMREAVKISQLGYNYYEKIYNEPVFTDEDILAEYNKNIKNYALVDYLSVTIEALYDETDDDAAKEEAKAAALKDADDIIALVQGGKSFSDAVKEICPELAEKKASSTETGESAEAQYKTDDDYLVEGAQYTEKAVFAFMFEEGAKDGEIRKITSEGGDVTLVLVKKLPYKDTTKLVDVRHILLDSTKYKTQEEAEAAANALLKQINESSDPKSTFISLVKDNSSDGGSSLNGGLYQDVYPGQMVPEFDAWCFDPDRKVGDTGIVLSDYGYHVMFFDDAGDELWRYYAETALRDEKFDKASEAIYEEVQIEYTEELLDKIMR